MRSYQLEAYRQCDESKESETIEADRIDVFLSLAGILCCFEVFDPAEETGYRTIAVRQNCKVTETARQ